MVVRKASRAERRRLVRCELEDDYAHETCAEAESEKKRRMEKARSLYDRMVKLKAGRDLKQLAKEAREERELGDLVAEARREVEEYKRLLDRAERILGGDRGE